MGALSNHLDGLLRCLESSGLRPPSQDVRIIEVSAGVNSSDGKHHVRNDELRRPSEYENRFDELLQTGYRWLNLSCYGVHEGFLIVAVEVPSATVAHDPFRLVAGGQSKDAPSGLYHIGESLWSGPHRA